MEKLTAVLCALISVFVFALTGCTSGDTFAEKAYASDERAIDKVIVQVEDRELEVSASEDDQIHIDYFDGEKEYLDISVSENKELTVKLVFNKNWTDYVGVKPSAEYRKIKIRVPDNLIAVFSASTTNASIKVNALSFMDSIRLDVNGGDIMCERVSVGKSIQLTAKDGDITGSIIGGWDDFSIACKIKKGECNLPTYKEDGEKALSADCNHGNINIAFEK